jgi:membrane protease YdiL (CAAX protease family)
MDFATRRGKFIALRDSVALALASIVVALLSVLVISLVLQGLGLFGTDAAFIIQYTAVQAGFLPLALVYLSSRDRLHSYINIDRPTAQDVGWILLIPAVLVVASFGLEPLFTLLGLSVGGAPVPESPDVLEQPALLLLVFVWWFLIAAPAEELLFRGVIQGRLRETYRASLGVLLASLIFVIPHVAFVLIDGGGVGAISTQAVQTFVSGLVFGIAYERTGNLVVPAVGHGIMWTSLLFVV